MIRTFDQATRADYAGAIDNAIARLQDTLPAPPPARYGRLPRGLKADIDTARQADLDSICLLRELRGHLLPAANPTREARHV